MAVDKVTLCRSLLDLRRTFRDGAEAVFAQARGIAGIDEELRAQLQPYAQQYRDAVQAVLAALLTAAQNNAPTNAEKVAYVNQLLLSAQE